MNKLYEVMVILKPVVADKVEAAQKAVEQSYKDLGVLIEKTDVWGKRGLAYRINNLTEGYYILYLLKADPAVIKQLQRKLDLIDDVVRYLIEADGVLLTEGSK
jgi:small subunit ribosomal protein S6